MTDRTIEQRVLDIEIHLSEINDLLIELWGHYQPELSSEEQAIVDKLMKLCRDRYEEQRSNK